MIYQWPPFQISKAAVRQTKETSGSDYTFTVVFKAKALQFGQLLCHDLCMHKLANCPGHWQVGRKIAMDSFEICEAETTVQGCGNSTEVTLLHFVGALAQHKTVQTEVILCSQISASTLQSLMFGSLRKHSFKPSHPGQWASQKVFPRFFSPWWPSRFQNRLLFSEKQ